ncbi:MAG: hypothetical protein RCG15_01230 [Candidatus Rickettsia vulgarisii]
MKSVDPLKKLIASDPIMEAKWRLEQREDIAFAKQLLKEISPYNAYAEDAINAIDNNSGAIYCGISYLSQYEADAFSSIKNGGDISNHWLIQTIQSCGKNVFEKLPNVAAITLGAFELAGVYGASAVGTGATIGYCVSGMLGSGNNVAERNDSNDVPFLGETKGGISQICDMKDNCWSFK